MFQKGDRSDIVSMNPLLCRTTERYAALTVDSSSTVYQRRLPRLPILRTRKPGIRCNKPLSYFHTMLDTG